MGGASISGTVVVTGASRGIGAAIAGEVGRRGANVVLVARGRDALEDRVARLAEAGIAARALPMDLGSAESIRAGLEALDGIVAELGPIGGLVNNAGIAESAPFARSDDALFERHLEINFHGPRRLCEALVPAMVEQGRGAVYNVASSAGLQGYAYVSAYCASKHALIGYTRACALELGPKGVRFGAICPHYVDSPMLAASVANVVAKTGQSEAEARAFFASQNPGGKLVTEAEVASCTAEWLAVGCNGAIVELTGSELRVLD